MKYYAIINGIQSGPMEATELALLPGFSGETPVWCETMTDWAPAAQVADLAPILEAKANTPPPLNDNAAPGPQPGFGPRIRPVYGAQPGQAPFAPFNPDPARRPYNWLGWSIFNTILGILFGWVSTILGIVGIIFSVQATNRYERCDYAGAESSARIAKIVNIIGLVILGVAILLAIALFGFAFTFMGLL